MIKIALIAVGGVLLALQLKTIKAEYSVYIGLVVSLVLGYEILKRMENGMAVLKTLMEQSNLASEYFMIALKMLGTAYLAELSAGLCRECGYQTIATQIEMVAKLLILSFGLPLLAKLLQMIGTFLK